MKSASGCHTFPRLDRHGKSRLVAAFITTLHQRQAKRLCTRSRQSKTDQPAAVFGHEIDRLGSGPFANNAQIAFILAILVIDKDEQLASGGIGNHILDR